MSFCDTTRGRGAKVECQPWNPFCNGVNEEKWDRKANILSFRITPIRLQTAVIRLNGVNGFESVVLGAIATEVTSARHHYSGICEVWRVKLTMREKTLA